MSWLRNRSVDAKASLFQRRRARLSVDVLEARAVPATMLVNDNWFLARDADHNGAISAGDTVDNRNDRGAVRVRATFGTNAFSYINAAVDASTDGDTVKVLQGAYVGNVTIDKSLTVLGANANVSAGLGAGRRGAESIINGAVTIDASDVTLKGFKIINGAHLDNPNETLGVWLDAGATGVTISNNVITGAGVGRGILSTFNGGNDDLTIQGNNISGWTTGIYNQGNTGVVVAFNKIHDNTVGIGNDSVTDLVVRNNAIFNNDVEGIGLSGSNDVTVRLNNFSGNGLAIHNYGGGDTVDASLNYWGTTNADAIAAMVAGDVTTSNPLSAPVTLTTHVFSGSDISFVFDTATGAFTLFLADGTMFSGRAHLNRHGRLDLHVHNRDVRVDIKGSISGTLTLDLRQGHTRQRFTLQDEAGSGSSSGTPGHHGGEHHDDDHDDDHDDRD